MFTAYRDTNTMVWEDRACLDTESQTALFYLHTPQNSKVNTIPWVCLWFFFSRCQFLNTNNQNYLSVMFYCKVDVTFIQCSYHWSSEIRWTLYITSLWVQQHISENGRLSIIKYKQKPEAIKWHESPPLMASLQWMCHLIIHPWHSPKFLHLNYWYQTREFLWYF